MSCGCNPKQPLRVVCCPPKRDPRCCKPKKDPCAPKPACQPPKITKRCSCNQILEFQKSGGAVMQPNQLSLAAPQSSNAASSFGQDQIVYRDVMY
jgi:hypothetical protein